MTADLTICNMALGHIGIPALTQPQLTANTTPAAKACNTFFSPVIDDLFREHQWPFADAQVSLNASSVTDIIGWDYIYDYPTTNCAAIWTVYNESTTDKKDEQDFEVKYHPTTGTRLVLSNLDEAYADISYPVTDTSLWDAKFKLAASYRLAAVMAISLGAGAEKALALSQVSAPVSGEAKRIGASEQRKVPDFTSSIQESRG